MEVTAHELIVLLADGRRISVPLTWYPRLLHATSNQRAKWELLGDGEGIHWPEIDEDLSVAGLVWRACSVAFRQAEGKPELLDANPGAKLWRYQT